MRNWFIPVLFVALIIGVVVIHQRHDQQVYPEIVKVTYAPLGGGEIPDVVMYHVRRENTDTFVNATLRNALRRPEGIEVCELVESELVLNVEDDVTDHGNLRDCDLVYRSELFFDYERAYLALRAESIPAAE